MHDDTVDLASAVHSHEAKLCVAAPVVNYDHARSVATRVLSAKAMEVQGYVAKLHKAQQAAESALDMCRQSPCRVSREECPSSCLGAQVPQELHVRLRAPVVMCGRLRSKSLVQKNRPRSDGGEGQQYCGRMHIAHLGILQLGQTCCLGGQRWSCS